MKYKTILFDLDGTLLDTNELILTSFLHTLETCIPDRTFDKKEIVPLMGLPLKDILVQFDADQIDDMVKVYREHNLRMHDEMVEAFPDVPEVVQALHGHGLTLGVVTTKQRNTAEMGLKLCGLTDYMRTLVTLQEVTHPKPHPEPVLKAMEDVGARPDSTLMVGDSRFDIEAARRAGIDSAGVAWSLKGEEHLQSFSPTYMLRDMKHLLDIVGIGHTPSCS